MALDLKKYPEQKTAGTITIFKIGPKAVALATPKYDVNTGEQLEADLNTFSLENIDKDIENLTQQLDALNALRADVAASLA